jgi:hypothetical protein
MHITDSKMLKHVKVGQAQSCKMKINEMLGPKSKQVLWPVSAVLMY